MALGQQLLLIEANFANISPRDTNPRESFMKLMETGAPVGTYNGDQPGEGIAMSDRAFVQTAVGLASRTIEDADQTEHVRFANKLGRDAYWTKQTRTLRRGLEVTLQSKLGGLPRYNDASGAAGAFLNLHDKSETDALEAETGITLRPLRGPNTTPEERENILRALDVSTRSELATDAQAATAQVYDRYIQGIKSVLPGKTAYEPTPPTTSGGVYVREFTLVTNNSGLVVEHMPLWGGPYEVMGRTDASGTVRKVMDFNRYTMSTGRGTPNGQIIDPGEHVVSSTNHSSATVAF